MRWLDPPHPNGTLTVRNVLGLPLDDHDGAILEWARDAWSSWEHHDQVDTWVAASLPR